MDRLALFGLLLDPLAVLRDPFLQIRLRMSLRWPRISQHPRTDLIHWIARPFHATLFLPTVKAMFNRSSTSKFALTFVVIACTLSGHSLRADDGPEVPRIDSVVMSVPQPQASDEAVIWYDDFDGPEKAYTETQGLLDDTQAFGGQGRSMLSVYEKGTRGTGNRKVFFGDSPTGRVVRKGQSFDDIYWRIYVKYQHGWTRRRAGKAVSGNEHRIAQVGTSHDRPRVEQRRGVDLGPGYRYPRRSGRYNSI